MFVVDAGFVRSDSVRVLFKLLQKVSQLRGDMRVFSVDVEFVHRAVKTLASLTSISKPSLERSQIALTSRGQGSKKESTFVACSFMVVLFEQGLEFGSFMNIRAKSLCRVQAGIPLPTRKRYPVKSTFKRTKFHYLSMMSVLKATKLT
ncbi:hypothetical protein IFM89_027723, partial [Coptis chinensis]